MRRRVAVCVAALLITATTTPASAAPSVTVPIAQSVGRFLDGSVAGRPIQTLADLADARASVPGRASTQDPLDVSVLHSIELPLTGALQLPQFGGITLGAANQVATASADGTSYGAAGAVANSGGASVGGDVHAFPSTATVQLDASTLGAAAVPGGGRAAALGAVRLDVGAVSALARIATPGSSTSTSYSIASLVLTATSPLVAALLQNLTGQLRAVMSTVRAAATALGAPIPADCPLNTSRIPDISYRNGAVVFGSSSGTIAIDVARLLTALLGSSADLDNLAPNTDLVDVVAGYLSAARGLAHDLVAAIDTQLVPAVATGIDACAPAAVRTLVDPAFKNPALVRARTALVRSLESMLSRGTNPLAPLGSVLRRLVDIGANVVPDSELGTFVSRLAPTPDQATAVVPGQTIVRALEIDVLGGRGAVLALANAASGPVGVPAVAGTSSAAPNALPTAVPAGAATQHRNNELPLTLAALAAALAATAAATRRRRPADLDTHVRP